VQRASSREVAYAISESGDGATDRASMPLVASLVLLVTSYLLLIAAPQVSDRMHGLAVRALPGELLQRWIPTAAGAGLALGGGSALIFVLSRLVRDMERRPYACLAPVLGVFCGALLFGLRAELPLAGIAAEHVAVFALSIAVLGGGLLQERRLLAQLLGIALTLLPTLSLVGVVWAASERAQLAAAIWSLSSSTRVFLALLGASSFAMGVIGLVARALRPEVMALTHWQDEPLAPGAITPVPGRAFAPREDTLELALREDERALRRRPLPRWAFALAPLAVLIGVAFSALQGKEPSRAASAGMAAPPLAQPAQDPAKARAESDAAAAALRALIEPRAAPKVESLAPDALGAAAQPAPVEPGAQAPTQAPLQQKVEPEAPSVPSSAQLAVQPAPAAVVDSAALRAAVAHVEPSGPSAPVARSASRAELKRARARAPNARKLRAAAPAKAAPVAREEKADEPAPTKSAPLVKTATPEPAKPVEKAPPAAPAAQDDSLESLMDRAVDAVKKGGKGKPNAEDDPIFGL
jgi:hypothetical protein